MSGLYLSYEETLDVPTLHKDFSWPEGFHELDWGSVVQVQIHCLKMYFLSLPYLLMENDIKLKYDTTIACDL